MKNTLPEKESPAWTILMTYLVIELFMIACLSLGLGAALWLRHVRADKNRSEIPKNVSRYDAPGRPFFKAAHHPYLFCENGHSSLHDDRSGLFLAEFAW